MTIARAVSRFPATHGSTTAFWVAVALTWSWIVIGVLAIVAKRRNNWDWPLWVFRVCVIWFPSVLFLPVCRHLFEMFFGCLQYQYVLRAPHPFYDSLVCWSSEHSGYSFLAIVSACVFVSCCVVSSSCFCDASLPTKLNVPPTDSSRLSTYHERLDMFCKGVLLVLFTAGRTSAWTYALGFVYCVCTCGLLWYHVQYLPMFQDRTQFLYIAQSGLSFWTGVCGVCLVFLHDSEAQGMLYFVGMPVILVGSALIIKARYNHVLNLSEVNVQTGATVVLIAKATIRSFYTKLASLGDIYLEETPELVALHQQMLTNLECVLVFGTERFPDDVPVRIFSAFFQAQIMMNRVLAYNELQMAEACAATFDERYLFFASRLHLDYMASISNSSDVQTYMRFKAGKDRADADMTAATRILIQFWTLLLGLDPNVDDLAILGHSARQLLARAQHEYEELLKLNNRSIPVLRTYGVVLLDVTGDTRRALAMFQEAENIDTQHMLHTQEYAQREFLQKLDTNLDIFDDRNAIFGISVDRATMGIIENANLAALKVFGYSTEGSVRGKNISIIVPQPMARHHDQYIM